jgi:hypothetical protein
MCVCKGRTKVVPGGGVPLGGGGGVQFHGTRMVRRVGIDTEPRQVVLPAARPGWVGRSSEHVALLLTRRCVHACLSMGDAVVGELLQPAQPERRRRLKSHACAIGPACMRAEPRSHEGRAPHP